MSGQGESRELPAETASVDQSHSRRIPDQSTIGPYHLLSCIGDGGMGEVWLAEQTTPIHRRVAVKLIKAGMDTKAVVARFESERQALAMMDHPGIARVLDAGETELGRPFFVMEYVAGVNLTEYCDRHRLSTVERIEIFVQVCAAVQHAHHKAVIHRDLKPSNILVHEVDGQPRAKVIDFGIAKAIGHRLTERTLFTESGAVLGTPEYMSPEQINLTQEEVDTRTDVYSLGVILYEQLAGGRPFESDRARPSGYEELRRLISEVEPPLPSSRFSTFEASTGRHLAQLRQAEPHALRNLLSGDLDAIAMRALEKDVRRRYATPSALAEDLQRYLRHEPVIARVPSRIYRARKYIRRHSLGVAVAGVIFTLTLAFGALSFLQARRTARERDRATSQAARTQRIQQFMLQLFEGGTGEVGPSSDLRVVDLLDRGAREAQLLEAEPEVEAELLQTLGGIAQNLGRLDQAAALLDRALDLRRRILGPDHPDVARSLVASGLLASARGKFDDAELQIRDGLAMLRRHRSRTDPEVAHALYALGRALEAAGRYPEAIRALEEAVQLQTGRAGLEGDLSQSLTELANCHFYTGQYAQADSLNEQVLDVDRRLYGPRHPHVADDLINRGAVQFEGGHYPEAERWDREALEIMTAWYGPDHPETAAARTILARSLVRLGRRNEAVMLLTSALATQERVYGPVHPRVASTLNEIGIIARDQGRLDDAATAFGRMADIYEKVHHGKHYLIGIALSNLGDVEQLRGNSARAEELFRRALSMYQATLPEDHPLHGIGRIRFGHALLAAGRAAESELQSRAGYEQLVKRKDPPRAWLDMARRDLNTAYRTLGRTAEADRFKAELSSTPNSAKE